MEIERALDQISEIHGHLAKTDVYRGYRAVPVGISGLVALTAAAFQPPDLAISRPVLFVAYWAGVALAGLLTAGGGILYSYLLQEDASAQRRTRTTVGQLFPSLAAGVVMTALVVNQDPGNVVLLPGLWAVLYSLGIFASRPYLPKRIGWVALYYFAAGAALAALSARPVIALSPWSVGITFGLGQLMAAVVLYWDLERNHVR